jgi:large subunit ribosomal protein L4
MDSPKTKEMANVVSKVTNGSRSALVLLAERNDNVEKSARNLANVKALHASYLNIRDLLGHQKLIIPVSALEVVTGYLGTGVSALVMTDVVMTEEEEE